MWTTIQLFMLFGTLLTLGVLILLALPQSQLRATLLPIFCWAFAIFCGLYFLSPIDLMPEAILGPLGIPDDIAAAAAGVAAVIAARQEKSKQKSDKTHTSSSK